MSFEKSQSVTGIDLDDQKDASHSRANLQNTIGSRLGQESLIPPDFASGSRTKIAAFEMADVVNGSRQGAFG